MTLKTLQEVLTPDPLQDGATSSLSLGRKSTENGIEFSEDEQRALSASAEPVSFHTRP